MLRCLRLGAAIAAAAAAGSAEAAPQGRPSRRLQNNAEERDERAILLAFEASGDSACGNHAGDWQYFTLTGAGGACWCHHQQVRVRVMG